MRQLRMTHFSITALPAPLLKATEALGYVDMTEIQAAALPAMLAGKDVIAQAKTGSGKTAAFGLAMLANLNAEEIRLQSLVLCPTRELADQVCKEIRGLARFIPNVKVLSLCGGISIRPQLTSLVHEPHIIVGTPGRIEDLINRKALDLSGLSSVILDEADRMLDMGFVDAIAGILKQTPSQRLSWFFSATFPDEIREISQLYQREPTSITVEEQHDDNVIEQRFYKTEIADKAAAVMALLRIEQPEACLIFCNTKNDVRELSADLDEAGASAIALHGDMEQRDRDETLLQFANGSRRVLVATDVAARGLDIKSLPMVIAYELSNDPDVHVHRVGRTGRAGEKGLVCNLVAEREMRRTAAIEALLSKPLSWSVVPESSVWNKLTPPQWATVAIDAGRRDKLRPGDILGALTGVGELQGKQVGKIDSFPTRSYVAVERETRRDLLSKLRNNKIKGRKLRLRAL